MKRRLTTFYLLLFTILLFGKISHAQSSFDKELESLQKTIVIDFKSAKHDLKILEKRYEKLDIPSYRFKLIIEKINLYVSIGDLARVKYELNKAKRFSDIYKVDPYDLTLLEYYNAVYKGVNGNFDALFKGVNHVLNVARKDDHYLLTECYIALARYHQFKGNNAETVKFVEQALQVAGKSKDQVIQLNVHNSAAQIYFFNNNYDEAKKNFESAFRIAKANKWTYVIQYSHCNLGEFYLFNDQPELAKYYLDLVVKHQKETELRDLYQVYSLLEYYYQDRKEIDSAFLYAAKKNEIDDMLESEQSDDLANELDKDFQSEKRKLLLEAKIQENDDLRVVFAIVFSVSFFFLVVLFLFLREKSRSNKLLLKQQEEITEKNRLVSIALQEKENLLKEIHHRVKNNLQVVSSILNLQARNITDPEALRIIEEGKERIYAISLIHNQLYLNKDVAFVEIKPYLEKLIHQFNGSLASFNKQIQVEMEVEEIELSIDTAVPVGLILCELLSNAYKHAFKDLDTGTIYIELKNVSSEERNFKLTVKDTGVGYHNPIEFMKQQSTGVEIISSLLQQLDAHYEYVSPESGFGIFIEFSTNHN